MQNVKSLDHYIAAIPEPGQIRERLSVNLAEAKLLRRLLKISQDKSTHDKARMEASRAS